MEGKKFKLIQLGCASNEADRLSIESSLYRSNFIIEDNISICDVIVILTCGFSMKQNIESAETIKKAFQAKKNDAELWVGGCIPAMNRKLLEELPVKINLLFNPRNFEHQLHEYLSAELNFHPISSTMDGRTSYPLRIINGCTEHCTYCIIKRAGGNSRSKAVCNILREVSSLGDNITEIKLVGEEAGAFGKDIETNLLSLVTSILSIRPDVSISFSAIHPKYFIKDFEMYTDLYDIPNVRRTLPIPIQSGSDRILKKMGRDYSIKDVITHVDLFRERHPEVSISTDIMVGFVSETWDDFLKSKSLVEYLPLSALDCFKFDDMNGIGDTVTEEEKIKRLKIISLTFIRNYCRSHGLDSADEFKQYLNNNTIPININY